MRRYFTRHSTDILYAVAGVGMALIIFLLFMLNIKTDSTVQKTHANLLELQGHIEADHDDQDRLLSCLVDLFANQQHPSSDQLNGCVAKTRIGQGQPAATGTAPASQASGPAPQGSASTVQQSPSQPAPTPPPAQSNTSLPVRPPGIPAITKVVDFLSRLF